MKILGIFCDFFELIWIFPRFWRFFKISEIVLSFLTLLRIFFIMNFFGFLGNFGISFQISGILENFFFHFRDILFYLEQCKNLTERPLIKKKSYKFISTFT